MEQEKVVLEIFEELAAELAHREVCSWCQAHDDHDVCERVVVSEAIEEVVRKRRNRAMNAMTEHRFHFPFTPI